MLTETELIGQARIARERAYVPYSRFKVGAALETKDGKIYLGCNIENASYGLTNCAERTAFFAALADGYAPGDFTRLAVIGDTDDVISPCGACRQVIAELGGNSLTVLLANLKGKIEKTNSVHLLPFAFSADDM